MGEYHIMLDETTFKGAYVGITASNREKGIRLNPYVEIRDERPRLLALQNKLLKLSIGCTMRKGFLRVQGIQNCSLIAPFVEYQWFKDCILLFEQKRHLTPEGVEEILGLCPRTAKTRWKSSQVHVQERQNEKKTWLSPGLLVCFGWLVHSFRRI